MSYGQVRAALLCPPTRPRLPITNGEAGTRHRPGVGVVVAEARELMLVRLRTQQSGSVVVGERQRTCHVVPYPETVEIPEFLTAYCGLRIAPGSADVVSSVGMPCEACLAHSSIPVFSMLRPLRDQIGGVGEL